MNEQAFEWLTDAKNAVIQHFTDRNMGRAQYPRKFRINGLNKGYDKDNNLVFEYRYKGESVELVQRTYDHIVRFSVVGTSGRDDWNIKTNPLYGYMA